MTDAELIRAVQAGDGTALDALYRRYLPSVWRYACARLHGDIHAAEDVTSDTFLAALRGLQAIDPNGGPLGGWLLGIARHKAGDHLRTVRRPTALPSPAAGRDETAAAVEAAEARNAVADALDKLPGDERAALEWKYLEGLSVREIGARLGRTEKAAEALLYRARQSFRDRFGRPRDRQ